MLAQRNPYVVFRLTQPVQAAKSDAVVRAEAAAAGARSASLLMSARDEPRLFLPQKYTVGALRAEHSRFNLLVDLFASKNLGFADQAHKLPDGSGYRFTLQVSRLLNHLDGHEDKFAERSCTLPDSLCGARLRKALSESSHKLPPRAGRRLACTPPHCSRRSVLLLKSVLLQKNHHRSIDLGLAAHANQGNKSSRPKKLAGIPRNL